MREAELSCLPGAPDSYDSVATEDLAAQPGYQAPPEEEPAPPTAAAAGPSAAPKAATASASAAAAPDAEAGPSRGAPAMDKTRSARHPLHVCVMHDKKVRHLCKLVLMGATC